MKTPTRVLIADDSALIRQVLGDLLQTQPDIDVIGYARNGDEVVRLTRDLKPDVVVLDIEMPRTGGVECLAAIMAVAPTPIVMLSSAGPSGVPATLDALERGAVDFVCKPRSGSLLALKDVRDELAAKIVAARFAALGRKIRRGVPAPMPTRVSDRVVLVAASTGGQRALTCLFETLPRGLITPILIVQPMPPYFAEGLAKRLSAIGNLKCAEAREGDRVSPGVALLAPGGKHMTVLPSGELDFTDGPPNLGVRPAADHLFLSAAEVFGPRCLGVVLTGMGTDGAEGAAAIRGAGGCVFVESEQTCTVYSMPQAVKAIGALDAEFPIQEMGHAIVAALSGRLARAS